jgi:dihydrofolate reductase
MILSCVFLTDKNNAIGKNNLIFNYIPEYITFFKKLTKGKPLIMGSETYETTRELLGNEKSIVISKTKTYKSKGTKVYPTLAEALAKSTEKKAFVIGGIALLKEALPHASEVYHTLVEARFKSESFMPVLSPFEWDLVTSECYYSTAVGGLNYCLQKLVAKKK